MVLNQTPRFDWYVVCRGSKNTHHKNTHLKEIELHLQILITTQHSIVNSIGRPYVFNVEINKHALPTTITKSKKVWFLIQFLHMFLRRLANATQHKFCCVILVGRGWRTWKTNQITPTHLMPKRKSVSPDTAPQYPKGNLFICGHLLIFTAGSAFISNNL